MGICQEVVQLGHVVDLVLAFRDFFTLICRVATLFCKALLGLLNFFLQKTKIVTSASPGHCPEVCYDF